MLVAVSLGVADADGGPVRQERQGVLVGVAERLASLLLGQVEVAPGLTADRDRHAKKRLHGRMSGREPVGPGVRPHLLEAERARVIDEDAEDAAAARKIPDRLARPVIHARGDEPLELPALAGEDTERAVARAGELAGALDHTAEHHLQVELADELLAQCEQPPERLSLRGGGRALRRHGSSRSAPGLDGESVFRSPRRTPNRRSRPRAMERGAWRTRRTRLQSDADVDRRHA
jgi:hypothetical protein